MIESNESINSIDTHKILATIPIMPYQNILCIGAEEGLFPVLFEYGISWKNPFKNEISKISSLYETVFNNFTHFKIDNIYFIFFSLIILTILVFYFFSELSFN